MDRNQASNAYGANGYATKQLSDLYYTPNLTSSFGGVRRLNDKVKRLRLASRRNVEQWLSGQDTYTLHRPAVKKFRRRPTTVSGMNEQLQIDLVDVRKYVDHNDGMNYILTAIDVFSKRAWAIPIKNKSSAEVLRALTDILDETTFRTIQSDKGKEFINKPVQRFLQERRIKHFTTENETIKASIVEGFNRTLQGTLHRVYTHNRSYRFIGQLDEVVKAYNSRYHSSIGMSPNAVNLENQEDVWLHMYEPDISATKPKLEVGDHVRISKARMSFERGYTPNWTTEIFVIRSVERTKPVTYRLEDYGGENVKGTFYEKELQKVTKPESYYIERVIKTKNRRGRKQYFVKWLGYPDSFNQWIDESEMV